MDFEPYRGELVAYCYRNGQPALAAYAPAPAPEIKTETSAAKQLHTLQVFTVTAGRITRNVVFADPRVFREFALPAAMSPAGATGKYR